MNEILINALIARIKAGHMTIEQAPIPYQEVVEQKLRGKHLKRIGKRQMWLDSILAALRSAKKY